MAQPTPQPQATFNNGNVEQEYIDTNATSPAHDIEKAQPKMAAQPVPANTPIPLQRLSKDPAYVECPFCNVRARTDVNYESSDATCAMAAGCCCILGIFGVWMPYVFHWGADTDHYCSSCKRQIVHVDHSGAVTLHVPQQAKNLDEKAAPAYTSMPGMDPKMAGNGDGEIQSAPQYVGDAHVGAQMGYHGDEKKANENVVLPSAC